MSILHPNCDCRDGQEVFLDGIRVKQARLGDLTILQVELSDEGNYTCRASNVYAEIETVSRVEVIKRMAETRKKTAPNSILTKMT